MLNYLIYKHTAPNGKVYIGQTCQSLERRCRKDGSGYKFCPYFYHAIKKYGWNNIKHETVSTNLSKEEADQMESYLIRYYNSDNPKYGYNLTKGGEGTQGYSHTEEAKRKIAEASRRRVKNIICVETNIVYTSITKAAELLNCSKSGICQCLRGKRDTALGYRWKYLN